MGDLNTIHGSIVTAETELTLELLVAAEGHLRRLGHRAFADQVTMIRDALRLDQQDQALYDQEMARGRAATDWYLTDRN